MINRKLEITERLAAMNEEKARLNVELRLIHQSETRRIWKQRLDEVEDIIQRLVDTKKIPPYHGPAYMNVVKNTADFIFDYRIQPRTAVALLAATLPLMDNYHDTIDPS